MSQFDSMFMRNPCRLMMYEPGIVSGTEKLMELRSVTNCVSLGPTSKPPLVWGVNMGLRAKTTVRFLCTREYEAHPWLEL